MKKESFSGCKSDILDEILAILGIGPFQVEDFTPAPASEDIQEQEHQNP